MGMVCVAALAANADDVVDAKITDTFKVGDKVMVHYTKSGDKRMASMVMPEK